MQEQQMENMVSQPGAPLDPFGNDDHTDKNGRIMPSQFLYPGMPVNLALIRNTSSVSDISVQELR